MVGYFTTWAPSSTRIDTSKIVSIAASALVSNGPQAAIFTPYHLASGGGERYILSSALVLQELGYFVTFMVPPSTAIPTIEQLKETGEALRIALDYSRLSMEVVQVSRGGQLSHFHGNDITKNGQYDVFYLLGNRKLPNIRPIGAKFNIYMCQFPFNYRSVDKRTDLNIFMEYDDVLVNSRYTHQWYTKSAAVSFQYLMNKGLTTPSVTILFPPVEPLSAVLRETPLNSTYLGTNTSNVSIVVSSAPKGEQKRHLIPFHERDAPGTFNIVMQGSFFTGRQSKGHFAALRILQKVIVALPEGLRDKVHLSMVGKIPPEPEHQQYASEIKGNVTVRKLPVSLLHNTTHETFEVQLQRSHVFWYLTGIDVVDGKENIDPASREHFGVSVVEAMSVGCVPIVHDVGGTADIVQNGVNGLYANSEADFVSRTLEIMRTSGFLDNNGVLQPAASLQALSEAAVTRSREFNWEVFHHNLYFLVQRGVLSAHFREVMAANQLALYPLTSTCHLTVSANARNVALIVAANIDGGFPAVTHNIMQHLPSNWGLTVVHSADSESFVKYSLRHILNVRFIALPDSFSVTSVKDYNDLMLSEHFWQSIKADKVLLFQTDSIILSRGIERYLQYDYVGAPWNVQQNERVRDYIAQGKLRHAVGNGGFSLRTVSAMIDICRRYANETKTGSVTEQEDLFVSRSFEALGYKVAPVEIAYQFSAEVPLPDLHPATGDHEPFALHAAWYYWPLRDIDRWLGHLQPAPNPQLRAKISSKAQKHACDNEKREN